MDQGGRDDRPDDAGVASAARRSFLRGFSRDAARSAGTLMGAVGAISGAPAAIGAELLGLREGAATGDVAADPPASGRAPSRPAATPPPADLRPWRRDGTSLRVVDQRALPTAHVELPADSVASVTALLESGAVPVGPAIAEVAVQAYAAFARETLSGPDGAARVRALGWNLRLVRTARPGSGALASGVARLEGVLAAAGDAPDPAALLDRLEAEADRFVDELAAGCAALADVGAGLLAEHLGDAPGLLTLGTSGPLAGGGGSAAAVIAAIAQRLPGTRAWVAETRPSLLGARIGALELTRLGVPTTVIADAAVAELARAGRIRAAIVPAEGLTPDGDLVGVAGTAGVVAQLAVAGIPCIVAAPSLVTAIAVAAPSAGTTSARAAAELLTADGRRVAAPGAEGWASLLDVSPRALLGGLIDESGGHAIDPD